MGGKGYTAKVQPTDGDTRLREERSLLTPPLAIYVILTTTLNVEQR